MVPLCSSPILRKILSRSAFFCILISNLLSGCISTGLTVPPPEAATLRLAALAPHQIRLVVTGSSTPLSVGHQYLFVAIPFGAISLIDPQTALRSALSTELAIGGIQVLPEGSDAAVPLVTVTPTDIRVTAFDLIFTRRVSATVRLGVSVTPPDRPESAVTLEVGGESGSFERFGFTPQLAYALREALQEAGQQLATTLQSSRRFRYDARDTAVREAMPPRPIIRRAL